ncbi:hypothetical protein LTR62_004887 [Meristemomyces frigidus]|uniref:Glycosyltransferase family 69 protein n=1 Tax=Meristemomyces frigidus TaxID=1508187 RepID=A0AAN7TF06_9PEZI|nr:hypothetical protein LTR62_004887 [Meristemomyces frigidus]
MRPPRAEDEQEGLLESRRSEDGGRLISAGDLESNTAKESGLTRSISVSRVRDIILTPQRRWFAVFQGKHLRRRSLLHRTVQSFIFLVLTTLLLILACGVFYPSYSSPPRHYLELRRQIQATPNVPGRGNTKNAKVFVAASLYDQQGELLSGHWGDSVTRLVDLLGPENVHVSVYEDNPDAKSKAVLDEFAASLTCNSTVVGEALDLSQLPHVITSDGTPKLSRIAFLAEVRNRALRPLDDLQTRFDKLLYLNDVVFDPVEAANLLFSTNKNEATGEADYLAACAMDFIKPLKFYDTFATRDREGFEMGVPFYPWFSGAGKAESRRGVLAQKDAISVKSCWSGMVAFDAQWFQLGKSHGDVEGYTAAKPVDPLRFRAENETFWEASECCLVHADLTHMAAAKLRHGESGIFLNPYIRVTYSKRVFKWLWLAKRVERLLTPVQALLDAMARMPGFNARRMDQPDEEVTNQVWHWDTNSTSAPLDGFIGSSANTTHGSFRSQPRIASPGAFCGVRHLSYINEHARDGEKRWGTEHIPAPVG